MSDRTPIIAGNWKMYKTNTEAAAYMAEFTGLVADATGVEIVICPPFTCLEQVRGAAAESKIRVGAQNAHFKPEGAYTGEVSLPMLAEIGVTDVILGHSERRQYFCENDADLSLKVDRALTASIRPILCVGETDAEREAGKTMEKLKSQLAGGLAAVDAGRLTDIVIAYEPIWAIGTGKTATPGIAEETIGSLREALAGMFGAEAAGCVRILYGGSVKPDNISALMAEDDIDGALVGGACLAPADFSQIVKYKQV